ncbi:AbrB family transcriptional regulator [Salicibibacter cibarius]|uniref:AbrB family transcriptional regulator n=1 Tax=Salicibibacter cibarius TaxID=2743000 RepID=A0A7T7CBZ5_9BACI|nr:AbrB family transcriptional regulator [Salicibibacter cibarius]QQK76472.1 AbrB family transcriptional regulator [Salicibibacter cibarius]
MPYIIYFILCGLGGLLFSFTNLSIAWMIGALVVGSLVAIFQPGFLDLKRAVNKVPKSWLWLGQGILGIQLGLYINMTLIETLSNYWIIILSVLVLSIIFAFITGFFLFYFTKTDLLSSFIATAPGGVAAMPAYAQEVDANVAAVSVTQVLRVVLVISTVPVLLSFNGGNGGASENIQSITYEATVLPLSFGQFGWTFLLLALALLFAFTSKKLKIPAPWLLGAMVTAAAFNLISAQALPAATLWWPDWALPVAQLFLGASIGAKMQKDLFRDSKAVIIVGIISSLALIAALAALSILVASQTQLDMITSILAFSPGGVAEMAATAVELDADSTFVVAVQVIRIMAVLLVLPPMFQLLRKYVLKEGKENHVKSS